MRFQHCVLLHLQRQSFLRIQHITKTQKSWMTQHSLWELGPLDILTSSCQRTWTKTEKNQSTLAIISLQISQVQWLVWRAFQTPLVSDSCLPRKKSCAICSEFIKCKILFPSLLFSCPPGRQNPRGSINNSIPFIFFNPLFFCPLFLSPPLLLLFLLLLPSSPPPYPSFLSLLLGSTWKTDLTKRSVVTMTENESYLLVENFPRRNQKFSYPFLGQSYSSLESVRHFPGGLEVALLCSIGGENDSNNNNK